MTVLSIEDMLAGLLKRKSGDGGDSRGSRRPSPPNTRGIAEPRPPLGQPQVAPAFVYREQAGDRQLNPSTDADLDPVCRYVECCRMLIARTKDRECGAGHFQKGPVDPGFTLRDAPRPRPIEALASAIAPEAPEQLALDMAYEDAFLAGAVK